MKKSLTPFQVDSIFISPDAKNLTITTYPWYEDNKHVHFWEMDDAEFLKVPAAESKLHKDCLFICDSNLNLTVVLDSELPPQKISPGIDVFAGDDLDERKNWLSRNIIYSNYRKEV